MKEKVELTPKDCLYLDDALSQLYTIATRISKENEDIDNKQINRVLESTLQVFSTHYDACKNLLKEACES